MAADPGSRTPEPDGAPGPSVGSSADHVVSHDVRAGRLVEARQRAVTPAHTR